MNQVWLVVSPQNPLKKKATLANDYDRLHLVQLAIEDNPMLMASNIEFKLPQPSYTIDTLTYLKEKYPQKSFTLIMGGDNLLTLPKWKNFELLVRNFRIFVYTRPGYELGPLAGHQNISLFDNVPQMDISASFIRNAIKNGQSVQYLLTTPVYEYLLDSNMYE